MYILRNYSCRLLLAGAKLQFSGHSTVRFSNLFLGGPTNLPPPSDIDYSNDTTEIPAKIKH